MMKGTAIALAAVLVVAGQATASGSRSERQVRPDLKVTRVADVPHAVTPGHSIEVRVTVRNRGNARAGASRLSAFLSHDEHLAPGDVRLGGAPRVKSLRRGRSVTRQRHFKVNEQTFRGDYRVIVCSDGREALREQSEANNCRAAAGEILVAKLTPPIIPPPR
jgi:hypothetical protein